MKITLKFIVLFLFSFSSNAQNIIINGDFENYDTIPDYNSQISRAIPWKQVVLNSDFWHVGSWLPWFDSTILAKSGMGYAGIGNSSNGLGCESFGQNISSNPLVIGKSYNIGAYCRNGNNFFWPDTCSQLAIYGFPNDVSSDTFWIHPSWLPNARLLWKSNSVSTTNWELKSGDFTCPITSNYIVITLDSSSCSQYVLIDSIFCFEIDKQSIDNNNCNYFMPNAFSPNNDNKNDFFKPMLECDFGEFNLNIFNRWGELVFHSNRINEMWDGSYKNTECEVGTYMYLLQYKDHKSKLQTIKGDVTIIR